MREFNYYVDQDGNFIIDNYNCSPLFSSFLPGIAGEKGIPIWAFYVNRGQGIISFGTRDKDGSILEFYPADKAYQMVTLRGFRTFLKINKNNKTTFYEPFQKNSAGHYKLEQRMIISSHQLTIEENNHTLGLKFSLEIFTLPHAPLGGLIRKLKITNLTSDQVKVCFVDGLPQMLPYGLNQWCIKNMSRTMEAFTMVENVKNGIPYLKLRVYPKDSEKVIPVVEGNFFVGFYQSNNRFNRSSVIVDSKVVFGLNADFTYPEKFFSDQKIELNQQITANQNISGFHMGDGEIDPQDSLIIYSLYGHGKTIDDVEDYINTNMLDGVFFENKREENRNIIKNITNRTLTVTSKDNFNEYVKQTFLDNALRGGVSTKVCNKMLYLYGRKHGDLERDYNEYYLQDTFFSQGNGDFRDVAQNRRCELFFNPGVGDKNIKYFFNCIQADGYNPLVLKNTKFLMKDFHKIPKDKDMTKMLPQLKKFTAKEFKFGELWNFLKENSKEESSRERLMRSILSACEEIEDAEFEKGYWSDHWTYLMDLLDNYCSIFPDDLQKLLLEDASYTFFDTDRFVLPRDQKYILSERGVRQYNAVKLDENKRILIDGRMNGKHLMRTKYGKGKIYSTTLLVKILTLILNKISSLDPFCVGIEMEADKPGWCDALNGLPSLMGSSLNETIELKRLVDFTLAALRNITLKGSAVVVPAEIHEFFIILSKLLQKNSKTENQLLFWDKSHVAKEAYRTKVFNGFMGKEEKISLNEIIDFLTHASLVLAKGIERGKDKKTGLVNTYFINEAIIYQIILEKSGNKYVRVKKFKQKPLPLFLEGQVHSLKLANGKGEAAEIHKSVLKTELYDKKLGMYRLNVPLGNKAFELGRIGIFNYGWLENGSIFLHMHYKYVMEMIRGGLLKEFYENISSLLIPFHDPKVYRRSIAENVSFLVSSGYPIDSEEHGRGYVSRLSGSTAEFVHIWSLLLFGPQPFLLNDKKELILQLAPKLEKGLFLNKKVTIPSPLGDKEEIVLPKNSVAFVFLGQTLIIYHNELLKNTFGEGKAHIKKYVLEDATGAETVIVGDCIVGEHASGIREGKIKKINVYLE